MDFQTMRIYGSIAIILGCFIFLYPKLLHPVVMTLFGMSSNTDERKADDMVPPQMRGGHHNGGHHDGGGGHHDLPDHIRKMRGPHPGMRAAAAAEQSKQTKGSGRGMMGVILPMYAVGIVVYLVYTLFKVFGKNDKTRDGRSPSRDVPRPAYDIGQQGDEQEEMDMRKLQERLAETEAQMTKILAAMQSVQSKVTDVVPKAAAAAAGASSDESKAEVKQEASAEKKEALNVSDRSSESSPESESYEIVNKSDRESSGDENSPKKVETLTATTGEKIPEENAEKDVTGSQEDEESLVEEATEEILKDKETNEEEPKNVRKRITKKEAES